MPAFDKSTLLLAKPVPGDWSIKCDNCIYKVKSCGKIYAQSKGLKHAIKWKHDVKIRDKNGKSETYQYGTIGATEHPPF